MKDDEELFKELDAVIAEVNEIANQMEATDAPIARDTKVAKAPIARGTTRERCPCGSGQWPYNLFDTKGQWLLFGCHACEKKQRKELENAAATS